MTNGKVTLNGVEIPNVTSWKINTMTDAVGEDLSWGRRWEIANAETERLLVALTLIRDYEPHEICKDEFAYDRMVEAFREAANIAIQNHNENKEVQND